MKQKTKHGSNNQSYSGNNNGSRTFYTFDGLPEIVVYRNVTENETMCLELYGIDEERKPVAVRPGQSFYMNEADRLRYKNDPRFLEGRAVVDSPEVEAMVTTRGENVMTDAQIHYLVKGCKTAQELKERISEITSITTLKRIRKECSSKGQDKPASFLEIVDELIEVVEKKVKGEKE